MFIQYGEGVLKELRGVLTHPSDILYVLMPNFTLIVGY
jgi:hypothetical protein